MTKQYTHLHVHSHASFLDSTVLPDELAKKAKALGMSAVALTDHSNLFNAITFYIACKKEGITPILGVEVNYVASCQEAKSTKSRQMQHLILLAETNTGWQNLIKLITTSNNEDNFYYSPRVDLAMLEKHKEGLIALSACMGGVVASHLREKRDPEGGILNYKNPFQADAAVRLFKGIFGSNNFFLEVQDHPGSIEQKTINDDLRKLALKHGLRTVVTSNVHYLEKNDVVGQKTLLKIGGDHFGSSLTNDDGIDTQYLKSGDELSDGILPEEIALTNEIAARCKVVIDLTKQRLPTYPYTPTDKTAISYLTNLVHKGFQERKLPATKEYRDRIAKELIDIEKLGFADYFLIVADVLNWARNQGILVGPARGSSAGSLVAYCLNITNVNPLQYGLIWERFLNVGRKSLPDVDSDIPRSKRGLVIEYIRERFGKDNVAQLATFNKLAARAALKDVFKVFGLDFADANKITQLLPTKDEDQIAISIDKAIEMVPELRIYEDQYKAWFNIAKAVEGRYKSLGTHAAAVVIADEPFAKGYYPLCRSADSKNLVFAWEMGIVDKLSLLKLDILGLSTLDVIQDTFDLIKRRHNIALTLNNIPLDDSKSYDLLGEGKTIGVFQLEKQLGRAWCKTIKPRTIEEIGDVVSIIRPAVLETGLADIYANVKNGLQAPSYIHPDLEPILRNSYSVMLYQEDMIEICKQIGGMSLVEADEYRRLIGKKKIEELKAKKPEFIKKCLDNGYSQEIADEIWSWLDKAGGYSFNKSHAISYALLAYYTAYLKANYPTEFFCAALKNAKYAQDSLEEMKKFIYDASIFGVRVTPPKFSNGNIDFDITSDSHIAFGLSSLKGVGDKAIGALTKNNSIVKKFDDLLTIINNKRVMEALIFSGALDEYGESRSQMSAKYAIYSELTDNEIKIITSTSDKYWIDVLREISDEIKCLAYKERGFKIPNSARRKMIVELLRVFDASDPFDGAIQKIGWEQFYLGISLTGRLGDLVKAQNVCSDVINYGGQEMPVELVVQVSSVKPWQTKKKAMMAFMTAGDETYELDNFVIFPAIYATYKAILEAGSILKLRGRVDDRGSVIVDRLERVR